MTNDHVCVALVQMINLGKNYETEHWPDNWTAATVDGKRSAQFEETLLYVFFGFCSTHTGCFFFSFPFGTNLSGATASEKGVFSVISAFLTGDVLISWQER